MRRADFSTRREKKHVSNYSSSTTFTILATYITTGHVARLFDDVDNLLCSREHAVIAALDHVLRHVVRFSALDGRIVQTNRRCVQVQVGVHGNWVLEVLRQSVPLGQEHKRRRQFRVEAAVALPKRAVFKVLGPISRLKLHMEQDRVEEMAHQDGAGKCRVRRSRKDVVERARRLRRASSKRIFRAGQMCCRLCV